MSSRFLNLDTDNTLGGDNTSDNRVASQKAVKDYVDNHSSSTTYTAGDGIDITNNVISVNGVQTNETTLAAVATSGSYNDLLNVPNNLQTTSNLVTTISSSSTNAQYPSAKCVYDIVGDIESAINTIRGV